MKTIARLLIAAFAFVASAGAVVNSSTTWVQYTLSTNPQALAVPFVFQATTDLLVLDTRSPAAPVTLTINSDYSVSGGNGTTGTVTTIVGGTHGVLVGDVITISRSVPLTQSTVYSNSGPLTAAMIGNNLDKLTMITQQLNLVGARSLQFGPDETLSGVLGKTARSGNLLGFDGSGNITWYPTGSVPTIRAIGTANQVLVNGTSGSSQSAPWTFTTPQSIGTGSDVNFGSVGTHRTDGGYQMSWTNNSDSWGVAIAGFDGSLKFDNTSGTKGFRVAITGQPIFPFFATAGVLVNDVTTGAINTTQALSVNYLNGGSGANANTYWSGNGTWSTPAGAGNVSNVGTPLNGQLAQWTAATTIQGVTTGTNVVTALGVNVGTPGSFIVNGGALGTPSGGNGSNLTAVNAATLLGQTWSDTGASGIGFGTPRPGAFTILSATGQIFSTGAKSAHGASRVMLSQENSTTSVLTAYGTDASTNGSLNIESRRSDGSGAVTHAFSSTGLAVTGTTTSNATGGNVAFIGSFSTANSGIVLWNTDNTSAATFAAFERGDATIIGSITRVTTTNAVAYNTTSDGRLKTNVRDFSKEDASRIIDGLRPRWFDWKPSELTESYEEKVPDPSATTKDAAGIGYKTVQKQRPVTDKSRIAKHAEDNKSIVGFVAQEEASVDPLLVRIGAVTPGDDDPETISKQWSRSDSALVPILVADAKAQHAINAELRKLIVDLSSRVEALESKTK